MPPFFCRCAHPLWHWEVCACHGQRTFVCRNCDGVMPDSTIAEIEASAFSRSVA